MAGGEPQKLLTRRAGQGTIEKIGKSSPFCITAGKGNTHDVQDQNKRSAGRQPGRCWRLCWPRQPRRPAPYLTPDSTVAELHGNEGIVGAGFDSWDRGSLWPEQPWEYARWSLRRYIGAPVDEAVEALNLIIENYNQGVQVTYPPLHRGRSRRRPHPGRGGALLFPGRKAGGQVRHRPVRQYAGAHRPRQGGVQRGGRAAPDGLRPLSS